MIKENKLKYLISSIIIILPSLVGLMIKDSVKGGMKGGWYFTWLMPLIMFALHTGLLVLTRYIDPVKQSKKIENIIFFIIPAISFYMGSVFIALILGLDLNIGMICSVLLGLSFIISGNYIPKAKRNRTFGIRIKWTLANDDNWNATHRISGKLYVIAGAVTLLTGFLPAAIMFIAITVILVAVLIIPITYSYNFYKKQIASGAATEEDYANAKIGAQVNTKVVVIITVVVVLLTCVLMTAGGLKFKFEEDALKIKPTFGGGIELDYSELKDVQIEYREEKVPGIRVMGYGSAKLLYGRFKNDEFGNYTRYTYTKSDESIVIYTEDGVIVIAGKTAEQTSDIYYELVSRINTSN